jgi:hypothetical protein
MSETSQSERQRMSIVALGSFNPAIFHPVWFARHDLIREAEASPETVKVVSPEVTIVEAEWFVLQVTTDRFSLETRDPRKFLPLRDLVVATFQLLEHTPVRAFGFNSIQSLQCESKEAWHHFGHHFAPKASWNDILNDPGMLNLTIQGTRSGCDAKRIQISIQPSTSLPNSVVISINEHYDLQETSEPDSVPAAIAFVETLERGWNGFQEYSRTAVEHLMHKGRLPQ